MLESINREAAKRTAKTVAKAIAIAVGIPLAIFTLPGSVLLTLMILAVLAGGIYTVYKVHLGQVEFDEKWKDSRFK
jgi:hypothetical protein